jgi:hypothetical protein
MCERSRLEEGVLCESRSTEQPLRPWPCDAFARFGHYGYNSQHLRRVILVLRMWDRIYAGLKPHSI